MNPNIYKLLRNLSKILLIVIGIGLVGYLGYRFYMFKVYEVTVSNVTSRSATISWVTDKEMPGMVLVREKRTLLPIWIGKYGMIKGYDDRDYSFAELQAADKTQKNLIEDVGNEISIEDIETEIQINELGVYWTHHVTVRNLDPETEYQFLVGDELVFKKGQVEENGNSFLTKEDPESVNTPLPAYGQIRYMYEDAFLGSSNTILYATLEDKINNIKSEKLSSVTNIKGNWYLDISSVKSETGEDFWSETYEKDISLVQINLIIEGGWMGRWSMVIDQINSSPAETIDIYDFENVDSDAHSDEVKFEGISYTQGISKRVLVKPSYAIDWCKTLKIGCPKSTQVTTSVASKTSTSKNLANQEFARQTNYYASKAVTYLTEKIKSTTSVEEKTKIASDLATATADKDNGYNAYKDGTDLKATDSNDKKKALKKLVDDKVVEKDIATKATGLLNNVSATDLQKAKGDCGNFDVCEPLANEVLTCGWLNKASCNCVCGEETPIGVPYGGTCSCSGGKPVVAKAPSGLVSLDENSIPKDDTHRCPNDIQGGKLTCLSSNGCWYSDGYYSSRTYADHGYTCTAGKDEKSWRWAGEGIAYVQYVDRIDGEVPPNEPTFAENIENIGATPGKKYPCYEKKTLTSGELVIHNAHGSFKCEKGVFVSYSPISGAANVNKPCSGHRLVTYFSDGSGAYSRYECNASNEWVKKDEGSLVAFAIGSPQTQGGVCDAPFGGICSCTSQVKVTTMPMTCVSVDINCQPIESTLKRVSYIEKGKTCGQASSGSSSGSGLIRNFVNGVFAEEEYIINTKDGIYEQLGSGSYIFEVNGDSYLVEMSEVDKGKDIYLDMNKSGIKDEGDVLVTESFDTISVKTIRKEFTYNLKKGINFVSFPFANYDTDIKMASDLLEYLNDEYRDAFYSIAKFDGGKWVIVGSNTGNDSQNDFQIIPGEGYILKTKEDVEISIYGKEVKFESQEDSVYIGLYPGWNLIGIYGSNIKTYTGRTLLEGITNYDKIDFTAVNVSRWEESKSMYDGIQGEKNAKGLIEIYGLDFPITKQRSYFVKITEGTGNWQPELR